MQNKLKEIRLFLTKKVFKKKFLSNKNNINIFACSRFGVLNA